jgi:hypothetical protein
MPIPIGHASGTYSGALKKYGPDHPDTVKAHGALITERILLKVGDLLDGGPPLTEAQVRRITDVLVGGAR